MLIPTGKTVYIGGRQFIGEVPKVFIDKLPAGMKAALEAQQPTGKKPKPASASSTEDANKP